MPAPVGQKTGRPQAEVATLGSSQPDPGSEPALGPALVPGIAQASGLWPSDSVGPQSSQSLPTRHGRLPPWLT